MSWESAGISLLTASLVRPVGLAGASWLMLGVFRVRHPASRHAVWTAVLIGTALLPVVSVVAPVWKLAVLPPGHAPVAQRAPSAVSAPVEPLTPLTYDGPAAKPAASFARPSRETLILWVYLAGVLAMLAYRAVGWVLLRRVVARSALVHGRLRDSADVLAPVAVSAIRPAVILPAGWRGWSAQTRRAVLAHEFAHLRRRDTTIAALARLVQCMFWFHPLAWWLSRTIANLAELACDAVALDRVQDPAAYSRILLDFTAQVNRAGRRAALPGLAMTSSAGMGRRIDQVFELSRGRMRRLSRPAATAAVLGAPVLCLAATVALGERQDVRMLMPSAPAPPSEAPALVAQAASQRPVTTSPQRTMPPPAFEVASIKISVPRQGGGGPAICLTPCFGERIAIEHSRVEISAITLDRLLIAAYRIRPHQLVGPAWVKDLGRGTRFDILATIPAGATKDLVPEMLQALLAERFKAAVHLETRELPVYALVVGKDGPKMKASVEADAPVSESSLGDSMYTPQGEAHRLRDGGTVLTGSPWGTVRMTIDRDGTIHEEYSQVSMAALAELMSGPFDNPVMDITNLKGTYQISWDRTGAPGGRRGARAEFDGPRPDFRADWAAENARKLEKLGLKLESRKAAVEVIVVDRLEKMPTEN